MITRQITLNLTAQEYERLETALRYAADDLDDYGETNAARGVNHLRDTIMKRYLTARSTPT